MRQTEISVHDVHLLREKSEGSLYQCKKALDKCHNIEVAYEYLKLKSYAVMRYKTDEQGNKKPYTDEDYIKLAESIVAGLIE